MSGFSVTESYSCFRRKYTIVELESMIVFSNFTHAFRESELAVITIPSKESYNEAEHRKEGLFG